MSDAPERIWLKWTPERIISDLMSVADMQCLGKKPVKNISDFQEWVRADLYATQAAEIAALQAKVELADARFWSHGMQTISERIEKYGLDLVKEVAGLDAYRLARAAPKPEGE